MVWSYPEVNVFSKSSGGWDSSLGWIPEVIEQLPHITQNCSANQVDASNAEYSRKYLVSTDPPYYNNVPYADLSDFFYMWLRKNIRDIYPEIFSTLETPKNNEIVAEKYRQGGSDEDAKIFFESNMKKALVRLHEAVDDEYPFTVYYAYKQQQVDNKGDNVNISSSGWETMLSALIDAKAGIVHLIERSELPTKVDTNEGNVWMLTQQLTHAMGTGGVESCAKIVVNMFGSNAERAKDLAYRLYTIAEQKKWANEAYAYNALVVAWPDIQSRAAALKAIQPKQLSLFDMM